MMDSELMSVLPQLAMYACAILAGLLAGVVNTLAGNGSALTLPMLMALGLPPDVANGTNRVGVVLSSFTGAMTFRRRGVLDLKYFGWLLVPTVLGGVVGAMVAVKLEENEMKIAIGAVMVVVLLLVVAKPNKWIKESDVAPSVHKPWALLILFLVGAYGGFIQAGVGILLLAGLVLGCGYGVSRANPLKVLIVFTLTVPALVIFFRAGQVHLPYGLLMGSGQMTGAWLGARFATQHPGANVWVRRLLIVVILAVIVKLLILDVFVPSMS